VTVRLILSLIENPLLALLAALIELPNNWFNELRDRRVYHAFGRLAGASAASRSSDLERDPTRIRRNKTLRIRLLHAETTIEIVCTFVSVRAPNSRAPSWLPDRPTN
jgi:hypothetical protein